MLSIDRTQPTGSAITAFLDATISLRKNGNSVSGCPDISFSIKTYEKIAKDKEDKVGDLILYPINLFFETLSYPDQLEIYKFYAHAQKAIGSITKENRRDIEKDLQDRIYDLVYNLNLSTKMIDFCKTGVFLYPGLAEAGTLPHHSPAKTFLENDYVEITAISVFTKLMVPIWGEFINVLSELKIDPNQREKIAFDLIEMTLEESAFERIYNKLNFMLTTLVADRRKIIDGKAGAALTTSSFIITHNGIDDEMFNSIVMAIIVVKRMAAYECFKTDAPPNAMVYIDDGIKRTADSKIQMMRNNMNTMPRRELSGHDTEDNSSILDHASKTSKKPIDVPVFVVTAVEYWDLPKLIQELNTPIDVFSSAVEYYMRNSFDISPLCQAMIASFIGTRFGGSKCINYLSPKLYQKIVILLQIYLIRQQMFDLAALITSKPSLTQIDGAVNPIAMRIKTNLQTSEYLQCQKMFKGFSQKPVIPTGKKVSARKVEMDTIDFTNHIAKMIEWLVRYKHAENMAPALWEFSQQSNHPIAGMEARFDENVISDLCRFYLTFHGGGRPF